MGVAVAEAVESGELPGVGAAGRSAVGESAAGAAASRAAERGGGGAGSGAVVAAGVRLPEPSTTCPAAADDGASGSGVPPSA
ncbi:hypothetical protein, partial [Nocardia farcinica]|uniref:hypothetical protein n=1 Tax=Nocardia farcinica TaxID=37329 RepID=UPI0024574094